jgi:hypothetical protein
MSLSLERTSGTGFSYLAGDTGGVMSCVLSGESPLHGVHGEESGGDLFGYLAAFVGTGLGGEDRSSSGNSLRGGAL